MPEVVNPYAPPAAINEVAEDPAVVALRRLRLPALGLLIVSSLGTVAFFVVIVAVATVSIALFSQGISVKSADYSGFAAFLMMGFGNFLIMVGSWNMRRGRRYRLCYLTGIIACVPITPFFLGIPFGIWALIVLRRKDVQEAFASKASRSEGASGITD